PFPPSNMFGKWPAFDVTEPLVRKLSFAILLFGKWPAFDVTELQI
ncbi:hypothetical protein MHK_001050, partial [Candidatus Magnetomorum sp. HK-1]